MASCGAMPRCVLVGVLALACITGTLAQAPGSVWEKISKEDRFSLWSAIISKANTRGATINRVTYLWAGVGAGSGAVASPAGTYLVPTNEGVLYTLEQLGLTFEQISYSTTACERLLKFHHSYVTRTYADLTQKARFNNPDLPTELNNQPTDYQAAPAIVLGQPKAAAQVKTVNTLLPLAAQNVPVDPAVYPPADTGAPVPFNNGVYTIDVIRSGTNAAPKFQGYTYNSPYGGVQDLNIVANFVRPSTTSNDYFTNVAAGQPRNANGEYISNTIYAVHIIDAMLLPPIPTGSATKSPPGASVVGDYFFSFMESLAFTPSTTTTMKILTSSASGKALIDENFGLALDLPTNSPRGVTAFVPTDAAWDKFLAATNVELGSLLALDILAPGGRFLSQVINAHFYANSNTNPLTNIPPVNPSVQAQQGLNAGVRYSAELDTTCYSSAPAATCQFPVLKTGLQLYPASGIIAGPTGQWQPTLYVTRQVLPGRVIFQVAAANSTSTLLNDFVNIYSGYPNAPSLAKVTAAGVVNPRAYQNAPPFVAHLVDTVIFPDLSHRVRSALEILTGQPQNNFSILQQALAATGIDYLFDSINNATIFLPTDDAFRAFVNNQYVKNMFPSWYAAPYASPLAGLLDDKTTLNKILSYHIVPFAPLDWRSKTQRAADYNYTDYFAAIRPTCKQSATCTPKSQRYPTLLVGSVLEVALIERFPNGAAVALADQTYAPLVKGDQNEFPMQAQIYVPNLQTPLSPLLPNSAPSWPTWYAFNGMYTIDTVLIPDFSDAFTTIASDPDLQYFSEAIQAAGLEATFSALRMKQIYAPNNLAFEKYLNKIGKTWDQVRADTQNLINLVTYHIVDDYCPNVAVVDPSWTAPPSPRFILDRTSSKNPNLYTTGTNIRTSLAGASIGVSRTTTTSTNALGVTTTTTTITLKGNAAKPLDSTAVLVSSGAFNPGKWNGVDGYYLNGNYVSDAAAGGILNIAPGEEMFAHFQIFKIDGVLIPDVNTASIPDVLLAQPDLTIFVQAYIAAGFQNMFENLNGVTIFAPNNNAFNVLLANLKISLAQLLANKNLLVQVISNHVVVGNNGVNGHSTTEASWSVGAMSAEFNRNLQLSTMWNPPASTYADNQPNILRMGSLNPPTMVSNSVPNSRGVIILADLRASTSYIHIVDSVLLPK